jgi:hypothetical protein
MVARLYFTSDYRRQHVLGEIVEDLQLYLVVNTSRPTVSMYESGEIHAGFMFTSNPYVAWAVKMCSMYERDPN